MASAGYLEAWRPRRFGLGVSFVTIATRIGARLTAGEKGRSTGSQPAAEATRCELVDLLFSERLIHCENSAARRMRTAPQPGLIEETRLPCKHFAQACKRFIPNGSVTGILPIFRI